MDDEAMAAKKQRAAELVITEIEELHRLRIHQKIRLTRAELNGEVSEFLARLSAAAWARANELDAMYRAEMTEAVRVREPKAL